MDLRGTQVAMTWKGKAWETAMSLVEDITIYNVESTQNVKKKYFNDPQQFSTIYIMVFL